MVLFFRQHPFEPFNFWVVFYGTLYAITILYIWNEKSYRKQWHHDKGILIIETIWIVAIAGILPNMVLALYGSTGMYFLSIQRFLASAFLLAYFPFLPPIQFNIWRRLQTLIWIGFALLLYMMYHNNFNDSWIANLEVRKKIMQESNFSWKATHFVENLFRPQNPDWQKAKQLFSDSLQIKLQDNSYFKFISKLKELDTLPVAEKKQALLYIPVNTLRFPQSTSEYALQEGMYWVGISRLALLNGLPHPQCNAWPYGYAYYDHSRRQKTWQEGFTLQELKQQTIQKGFEYLYIFQPESNSFTKITCFEQVK